MNDLEQNDLSETEAETAEESGDSAEYEDAEETEDAEEEAPKKKRKFHFPGKKLLIWLLVIAVGLTTWYFLFGGKAVVNKLLGKSSKQTTTTYVRTVTLTKGSLENTVTASGTIASQDTSNVTTTLKYTVKTIDVAVGDTVQAGDTIVTLDTTELEQSIARKEEADAESLEKLQKAVSDATYAKEAAYKTMADAKTTLDSAEDTLSTKASEFNSAAAKVTTYQTASTTATSVLAAATDAQNACAADSSSTACTTKIASALSTIESSKTTMQTLDNYSTKVATSCAVSTSSDASALYKCASAFSEEANAELGDYEDGVDYTSKKNACEAASSAESQAQSAYDKAAQNFNTVNAQYIEAQENLAKGVTDDDLEDLKTDLANCTLTAETGGTVTAINATVGSAASGTVATISNTSSLQISVNVDEYDIQSIQKGMKATITSDAIDQSLSGTVKTVSPVATTSGSSSSSMSSSSQSSSSFAVVVTLDDTTNALLIGMSAEVKIILSSTGDVYTVPIDAVGKDDSGNSVIYVRNSSGDFDAVQVTTGDSNDYYIEVSGSGLSEGLVVRASADASAATVTTAEPSASASSGALDLNLGGGSQGGGNGGGGAPSGGGGAPSGGGPGGGN